MPFSCSCNSTKLVRTVPSEHVTVIRRLLSRFLKWVGSRSEPNFDLTRTTSSLTVIDSSSSTKATPFGSSSVVCVSKRSSGRLQTPRARKTSTTHASAATPSEKLAA
tara:strand:+ start:1087 stop:1407 length:321 start_codon:yes stop_codon:yes gene_type:complete